MITRIFTPENLARIPKMVEQGMSRQEIAAALGCKLNSLITTCSINRISLRRWPRQRAEPCKVKNKRVSALRVEAAPLPLRLSMDTVRALQLEAYRKGVSTATLASTLLDTIAKDGLCNAVLDEAS
jgi:hypothetical protein